MWLWMFRATSQIHMRYLKDDSESEKMLGEKVFGRETRCS
jgi:hypothetical protein